MDHSRDFKDLIVWQKSLDLAAACHSFSARFPPGERYGLALQIRRSAVSIPSNIAEGQGRKGSGDFLRFLRIAQGSLAELHTQLLLAHRFGYAHPEECRSLLQNAEEVARLLNGLYRAIKSETKQQSPN